LKFYSRAVIKRGDIKIAKRCHSKWKELWAHLENGRKDGREIEKFPRKIGLSICRRILHTTFGEMQKG
jgi:hypothetical protein